MGTAVSTSDGANLPDSGVLYVVATPIGNLNDISARATQVLSSVDAIACEDTRHTGKLLRHLAIRITSPRQLLALHQHNEREQIPKLISRLQAGESIALVSDAGTPLVSDPGFQLVRAARDVGVTIIPVPGACAAIAALSVAGLPSDRFVFEGFPPSKAGERREHFRSLRAESRTIIFYEAPHRVIASLRAMAEEFGPDRAAVVARELTKRFETVRAGGLQELADWLAGDPVQQQGEFVIVIHGATTVRQAQDTEGERVLRILLASLPVSQAADLAAAISGAGRRTLYQRALALRAESEESDQ
ncbi:MAG: 16S rRNA (cytidine(1402)-2'-O)-methyltransferase [Pseudomonadota bacterium]|nr:MAG: 16S rRNA (cytidine(1402)-2'-O)-methyltransferase [Pseudomonadota bacterium]